MKHAQNVSTKTPDNNMITYDIEDSIELIKVDL